MRVDDKQAGFPYREYVNTKANIEALVGVTEGCVAYATDTNELGTYDGADWQWVDFDFIDQDVTIGSAPSFTADNFSDGGTNVIITTTQESNFEDAYTHIGESGASHTYIDQDITIGSSPTFDGNNFTGIDADNVDIIDAGSYYTGTTVEAALQEVVNLIGTGSSGVTDHALLSNLDYASAAHTGFLEDTADVIKDTHIDWGAGASQVGAVDIPIADGGSIIDATEVEGALQENRTAIDLNTTHRTSDGSDHTFINQDVTTTGTPTFASLSLPEVEAPGTPAENVITIYNEEFHGFGFLNFIDDTDMVRKLVRDNVFVARADEDIAVGDAVYVSNQTGNVPEVSKAKADSLTTMPAVGISVEAFDEGDYGRVMMVGLLENFDTSLFAIGDPLYVSKDTAGLLTATAPLYPNIRQEIGLCLVVGVGNGAMQVLAKSLVNEGVIDHGGLLGLDTGSDHSFIDQDVTSGSSPVFDGTYFTGIDAEDVDIVDTGSYYTGTTVESALQEIANTSISGSSGGHVIQEDSTPLAQRKNLNFVGNGFEVWDDVGNDTTIVSGTYSNVADTDELVKISSNDTTASYLYNKVSEGIGISITEINNGGDEDIQFSFTGTTTNWDAAYAHISEDGSSHTFIDQSIVSGSSPWLDGNNFTGIPDSALDTDYVEVAGDTMTGALKIDTNSATALVVEQDGVHDDTLVVNTASGTVGIGDATPVALLDVGGGTQFFVAGTGIFQQIIYNNQTVIGGLQISCGNADGETRMLVSNDEDEYISFDMPGSTRTGDFAGLDKTDTAYIFQTGGTGKDLAIGTLKEKVLAFMTQNLERMRIDGDGKVGIGTTAPASKLEVNGGCNIGGTGAIADNDLYVVDNCSALSFTDRP